MPFGPGQLPEGDRTPLMSVIGAQKETSFPGGSNDNLPARPETWVQSLGWKDPLEKGITTHSNILAWRIPWTKEPGGLQYMGLQRVRHD